MRPVEHQVDDLLAECRACREQGQRVLVTTLTKRMAEDLSEYLHEQGVQVRYMHSDIDTLERIEIIRDLRLGKFDVLVGINLLREGLDIPECGLVAILDADKEGYLRSETSLVQTIGRAARNVDGRVILYADTMTRSLQAAIGETERRREKQVACNEAHGITPQSDQAAHPRHHADRWPSATTSPSTSARDAPATLTGLDLQRLYRPSSRSRCARPPRNLEFEEAARLRDEIRRLEDNELGLATAPPQPGAASRRRRLEAQLRLARRQAPRGTGQVQVAPPGRAVAG